jgi:arylsulfatase A-like enzyme
MATCADLLGKTLPANAGEDSVSVLPLLLGKKAPAREAIVHHSHNGSFAIRQGSWKLIFCGDAGSTPPTAARRDKAENDATGIQLFDLSADIGERSNLAANRPDIVERLTRLMERYVREGRSTPGARQANDVTVDWKSRASGFLPP